MRKGTYIPITRRELVSAGLFRTPESLVPVLLSLLSSRCLFLTAVIILLRFDPIGSVINGILSSPLLFLSLSSLFWWFARSLFAESDSSRLIACVLEYGGAGEDDLDEDALSGRLALLVDPEYSQQ